MSTKEWGKVVTKIDIGDRSFWAQVGSFKVHAETDRGPGISIRLDKHFNPAGTGTSEVYLSLFWPTARDIDKTAPPRSRTPGTIDDDDIPF